MTISHGLVQGECLLDGDKTGAALPVSPLLPDEGLDGMNGLDSSSEGRSSHPPTLGGAMGGPGSVVGGMVGTVGGMYAGRKFLYGGATPSDAGSAPMFVLVAHHTVLVARLTAGMQALYRLEVMSTWNRRTGIRDGAIAYTAWRRIRSEMGSFMVP
ncbi:hypothetical protein M758_4G239200 [Ceratodon purpureus]|nr:hypothetical protein M758_4G239200 [Ceratodon purpureus]